MSHKEDRKFVPGEWVFIREHVIPLPGLKISETILTELGISCTTM